MASQGLRMSTHRGARIRYVGIHGRETGPCGKVIRQLRCGDVRVRWDDRRVEDVHPEDVQPIGARVTDA
ncbi:hypothetical protein [Mycolicibacter minnesotensis]